MAKKNYYLISLQEIEKIRQSGMKPKILLHTCCGPCATFPVKFLFENGFDVTIFFNNSNIYPKEEYQRRRDELVRFIDVFNRKNNAEIKVIISEYDNASFNIDLAPYGNEDEGLTRCKICYAKRMKLAFSFADENRYDYFTTVMTISRQKDSQILNDIGEKLQSEFSNTKYFYSDFKKNKGIDTARDMRIEYGLYQQDYCGCKFTYGKSSQSKNIL